MTINGVTQNYNFPGIYSYQMDPFVPSVFTFPDLPEVVFDLGSDGILVGEWSGNSVTCHATINCSGGVFPFIRFTRQAAGVPESASLGLLGMGFVCRRRV